jgi:hypothetical protein
MKNIFYLLILLTTILLSSCTPDSPVNTGTTTPFTLKYEIVNSAPLVRVNNFRTTVNYINSTGQEQYDTIPTGATIWTKEIIINSSNTPFFASMYVSNIYIQSTSGSITGNIYVNGTLVATQLNQTYTNGSVNWSTALVYLSKLIQ